MSDMNGVLNDYDQDNKKKHSGWKIAGGVVGVLFLVGAVSAACSPEEETEAESTTRVTITETPEVETVTETPEVEEVTEPEPTFDSEPEEDNGYQYSGTPGTIRLLGPDEFDYKTDEEIDDYANQVCTFASQTRDESTFISNTQTIDMGIPNQFTQSFVVGTMIGSYCPELSYSS